MWSHVQSTLRPILGLPGARELAEGPTPAGQYIARAASANGASGLVEGHDGSLLALQFPSGSVTSVAFGLPPHLQIRFSPLGAFAVAFAPGTTELVVVSGLPASPRAQTFAIPAGLESAEVGDTGTVIGSFAAGNGQVLQLLTAGNNSALSKTGMLGAISFLPNSDDLIAVDNARGTIEVFRSVSSNPTVQSLKIPEVLRAVGVAGSSDGPSVAIANGGDQNVLVADLTGHSPTLSFKCQCQPSGVEPLLGNTVFRITDLSSGLIWTIDASPGRPRLLFIPTQQQPTGKHS